MLILKLKKKLEKSEEKLFPYIFFVINIIKILYIFKLFNFYSTKINKFNT